MGGCELMQYRKLICIIEKYINSNTSKESSQKFCDKFMDEFFWFRMI